MKTSFLIVMLLRRTSPDRNRTRKTFFGTRLRLRIRLRARSWSQSAR